MHSVNPLTILTLLVAQFMGRGQNGYFRNASGDITGDMNWKQLWSDLRNPARWALPIRKFFGKTQASDLALRAQQEGANAGSLLTELQADPNLGRSNAADVEVSGMVAALSMVQSGNGDVAGNRAAIAALLGSILNVNVHALLADLDPQLLHIRSKGLRIVAQQSLGARLVQAVRALFLGGLSRAEATEAFKTGMAKGFALAHRAIHPAVYGAETRVADLALIEREMIEVTDLNLAMQASPDQASAVRALVQNALAKVQASDGKNKLALIADSQDALTLAKNTIPGLAEAISAGIVLMASDKDLNSGLVRIEKIVAQLPTDWARNGFTLMTTNPSRIMDSVNIRYTMMKIINANMIQPVETLSDLMREFHNKIVIEFQA